MQITRTTEKEQFCLRSIKSYGLWILSLPLRMRLTCFLRTQKMSVHAYDDELSLNDLHAFRNSAHDYPYHR
jgi:hypothetical protein